MDDCGIKVEATMQEFVSEIYKDILKQVNINLYFYKQ